MNEIMRGLGAKRSVIRELFEYGCRRKAEIGEDKVFDFSLGNPSVPAPNAVTEELMRLLRKTSPATLHGYTSAAGDRNTRLAIADYLNRTYDAHADADLIYMTVGAAASLTVSLSAILNAGDEVILLAPFFPEYRVFVERTGAKAVSVLSDMETFQPDFASLEEAINEKTAAIIVNSPNNPSGAVLGEESIRRLSALLEKKQKEYGHSIYLISDEPYRELVYSGEKLPYFTNYYDNTVVCYSFSKSLSLPGERIGYILVSSRAWQAKTLFEAICGAGRALGFVCAPALFQKMIPACLGLTADVEIYRRNRDLLCEALTEMGFRIAPPDGAFYLFVKAPGGDANVFSEMARELELLLVPSDDFGCEGFVRISYCVSTEQILSSLPAFRELARRCGMDKNR